MNASPHLGAAVLFIVIGAGALHACWNAIAKNVDDRLMAFAVRETSVVFAALICAVFLRERFGARRVAAAIAIAAGIVLIGA
ncbi:MAG TPA: EamA family transporter [Streptosporangiaceae bacterium]|jgi:drug/metabolite transporter (DMT)-like permease